MHGDTATPRVLILLLAEDAVLKVSSSEAPVSAIDPAILKTKIIPDIPLRFNFSSLLALAISSATITVFVLIPSEPTVSQAISKFITSPP